VGGFSEIFIQFSFFFCVEDLVDREIIPGSFARSLIAFAQLGGKLGKQISPLGG
jgi:hypothetical protein